MRSFASLLSPRPTPAIVAILNVTPDSFYDGGALSTNDALLARAEEVIQEGAEVLELGGESTGPKSLDVSLSQEKARLLPALGLLRQTFPDALISIDTYKAALADAALLAGADCINDVTAGRSDEEMFSVLARHKCPCVLMFSKDATPRTTIAPTQYDDVIETIYAFLSERMEQALEAGVEKKNILIDPGLGHFVSSDPSYSFQILAFLDRFVALAPVFISPSRKSFLAGSANVPAAERLPATLAASIRAAERGAQFIRTHDVGATKEALRVWSATRSSP